VGAAPTDPVPFADPMLAAAAARFAGSPDGILTEAQAETLEILSATREGIVDLDGIEFCANLEHLDLTGNAIVDLTPLEGLTRLQFLSVWNNDVTSLAPLERMERLLVLWADHNRIVDISPLAGLSRLGVIYLRGNRIVDLEPLRGLEKALILDVSENAIEDLSPVASLTELRRLRVFGNAYDSLEPIRPLRQLTEVAVGYLGGEPRSLDLTPLLDLPRLTKLLVAGVRIPDLSFFAGIEALVELHLDSAGIVEIASLAALPRLRVLGLNYNRIEDITPLLDFPALTHVWLIGNPLDLSPGSPASETIAALEAEGVRVGLVFEPPEQRTPTGPDAKYTPGMGY
jgi:Leucine-rich repeat (LRR) protein